VERGQNHNESPKEKEQKRERDSERGILREERERRRNVSMGSVSGQVAGTRRA
jgi:hypothetical protein